jgi:hypothetical protein
MKLSENFAVNMCYNNSRVNSLSGRQVGMNDRFSHIKYHSIIHLIQGLHKMKKPQDYYVYTHSFAGQPPFYVGKGLKIRTTEMSRRNKYHTNIVKKYGKENIIVKAMLCRDEQHALTLEVKMIAALRNGGVRLTNLTDGGEGMSGWTPSAETRAKMSAVQSNRSPETRAKISAVHTGAIRSPEARAKMSIAAKGKVVSLETRAKMSIASSSRTPETRAKLSAAKTGVIFSPETRAKLSAAAKGKPKSPESIAKGKATRKANKLAKAEALSALFIKVEMVDTKNG